MLEFIGAGKDFLNRTTVAKTLRSKSSSIEKRHNHFCEEKAYGMGTSIFISHMPDTNYWPYYTKILEIKTKKSNNPIKMWVM